MSSPISLSSFDSKRFLTDVASLFAAIAIEQGGLPSDTMRSLWLAGTYGLSKLAYGFVRDKVSMGTSSFGGDYSGVVNYVIRVALVALVYSYGAEYIAKVNLPYRAALLQTFIATPLAGITSGRWSVPAN